MSDRIDKAIEALEYYAVALPRHKERAIEALALLRQPSPTMMPDALTMRSALEWEEEIQNEINRALKEAAETGESAQYDITSIIKRIQENAAHIRQPSASTAVPDSVVVPDEVMSDMDDAVKAALATLNVEVVCKMAREDTGPCDMTPFRILHMAALQTPAFLAWLGGVGERTTEIPETANLCKTCKGAGTVWARCAALPDGFKAFCGSAINRSEDRKHMEITCPECALANIKTEG